MNAKRDFREIYCTHHAITEAEYFEHFLRRALPPHARAYRTIAKLAFHNHALFRADLDFIEDIGRLRRYNEFGQSVDEFISHPWNQRGLLRWWLRIRVSTTRVRHIVRDQLKAHQEKAAVTVAKSAAALPVEPIPVATTPKNLTESPLTGEQKSAIRSRLEQLGQGESPEPIKLSSPRATAGAKTHPAGAQLLERTRSKTLKRNSNDSDLVAQLEVLQVINERLKTDLARVTAQRDVLKQAAAILAAP